MDLDSFRSYCLAKKGVTEELPFGPDTLVFKVAGKMFALTGLEEFERISLKVEPEVGATLREEFSSVVPAFHMNKKHWINVIMDGSIPDKLVKKWIDDSYALVVAGLPKKVQSKLG